MNDIARFKKIVEDAGAISTITDDCIRFMQQAFGTNVTVSRITDEYDGIIDQFTLVSPTGVVFGTVNVEIAGSDRGSASAITISNTSGAFELRDVQKSLLDGLSMIKKKWYN